MTMNDNDTPALQAALEAIATPDGPITLRDIFAAAALMGMMSISAYTSCAEDAKVAYDAADAMMAERLAREVVS